MAKRGRKPSKVTIKNFPKSAGPIIADALEPKAEAPHVPATLPELVKDVELALLKLHVATSDMLLKL